MSKEIKFGNDARKKVCAGVNITANAVVSTLGPGGRGVLIRKGPFYSYITKDGVSVAKSIALKDNFEDAGSQLIKEAANKTLQDVGDGTTSTCLLAQSIYNDGFKLIEAGYSSVYLKIGIDKAVKVCVEELNKMSVPVEDAEAIEQVGTISGNSPEVGKIFAEAFEAVGKDGLIVVENNSTNETILKKIDGMNFDRGYITPYFITNVEKVQVELTDPWVFLYDGKLDSLDDLVPLLNDVVKSGRPIIFIAENYSDVLVGALIQNKQKGALLSCPIRSPGFGERRKEILKDLAALTGGCVIGNEAGVSAKDARIEHLGSVEKIIVDRYNTLIMGGKGESETIQARANQIKDDIKNCGEEYDKKTMRERLAKLTAGICKIAVGGNTDSERAELRDRYDDALSSTRAAVLGGIVVGGGVALLRCKTSVEALLKELPPIEAFGAKIVLNALEAPLRKIVDNAGGKADVVLEKVINNPDVNYGYDAKSGEYVNMFESGIVDPTLVVKNSILNGSSVAGLLLNTDVVIVDEKESKE
jgi:chaperonin GroEL